MAIIKELTAWSNAPVEFHRIMSVEYGIDGVCKITVKSWTSQFHYDGLFDAVSTFVHQVALAPSATPFADAQAALLSSVEAFDGGVAIEEAEYTELYIAKARRVAELKFKRDRYAKDGFTWDSSLFGSEVQDQVRLGVFLQEALRAEAASESFSVEYTLKNSDTRVMSIADMKAVNAALAAHLKGLFDIYNGLYDDVALATTVEAVQAVVWPT